MNPAQPEQPIAVAQADTSPALTKGSATSDAPVKSVRIIPLSEADGFRRELARQTKKLAAERAGRLPKDVQSEEDIVRLIGEEDLNARGKDGQYVVKAPSNILRNDNGATGALCAYLQPTVERHLDDQALMVIRTDLAWPVDAYNSNKFDINGLGAWPDQLGALCKTIDDYALLAGRFIRNMPDGIARIRAGALDHVNARFPDQEDNGRRVDGALIWRPLLAPFNDIQAAAMAKAPDLQAYVGFCNMVLQKLVFGLNVEGLKKMPDALQAAINNARRTIVTEMQAKLHG